MTRRSPEQKAASRDKVIEASIRVIADEGWGALTTRRLEILTAIDRTTISSLLPADVGAREKIFITVAFEQVRSVASGAALEGKVHFSKIQQVLLLLFEKTSIPVMTARICGLTLALDALNGHFMKERNATIKHIEECCAQPSKAERLLDWYIGACAVFVANPGVNIDHLLNLGVLLGNDTVLN